MPQFWELCDQYGWRRNSQEGKEALNQIRNAIALQFNAIYGSDENSLNGWHNLFRALQTPEIPETVKDCKERIKTIHVNICDLVDHFEDSKPRQFPSAEILAEYSRTSKKIFPRKNAYAGGLLKYLLRDPKPMPTSSDPELSNPIRDFFDSYPDFDYDEAGETMAQFWELCEECGWEDESDEKKEALNGIRDAIAQQFNAIYGSDAESLDGWHNLFRALQVPDIPDTVEGCKTRIDMIHVNICDLVDFRNDRPAQLFDSESLLAAYSRRTGKIYPKDNAYAGGLLRFLLRQISGPGAYHGRRRSGGHGQARGGRKSKKSNPTRPRQK
ncbi:hypothetical protein FB446DRAFT_642217 [Lentinula raphanica]|nr:hypothetical protein FB446DRAFT_642217 [Lentinula raphanica]